MPNFNFSKKWFAFLFLPIPFVFYWYTCLPSIGLGDSALYINEIKHLIFSTYVNNHNLTILWGWLAQHLPGDKIAYKGNLSCVFTSGLAVCIFYISIYILHRCWSTALISSLFFMISQSMWWHGTDLTDYSMNTVFVTISLYLYVRLHQTGYSKYLLTLFFISGLALFQHYLLGSLLIGSTAALLFRIIKHKENAWPLLWKSALCFSAGLIPWAVIFHHDLSISHSISETISGCLGGPFKKLFFKQPLWNGLVEYLCLIFIQFPSFYILPVVLGPYLFLKSWKWDESSLGVLFTIISVIYFEIGLNTWALFSQYLVTFVILAFWSSFCVYRFIHHPVSKSLKLRSLLVAIVLLSLAWTVYFYARLSTWGNDPNSFWYSRYNNTLTFNTYRVNEFLANPDKRNYRDIADACRLILAKLPPHSEFWDSDSRLYFQLQLYYQQFYHRRLDIDIELINSFLLPHWGADRKTFAQSIKYAYLSGKDFFLNSLGWPESTYLSGLPDANNYHFKRFKLDDKRWVYKLITLKDKNHFDTTLWHRWDFLPTNKTILIDLTLENVLDFHEGNVIFQKDMHVFGPYWKNDTQVFFAPAKQGAEIGFLLRFHKAFTANLTLHLTTAFDAGMVEILLNGTPLTKEPIDLYMPNVYNKKYELKNVSFESENNILSIRVIGKDDKSSSMNLGVDTIQITPTLLSTDLVHAQ